MLRIRREQMEALGAARRRAFLQEAIDLVERLDPPLLSDLDRGERAAWAVARVERADAFELFDPEVVLAFIEVSAFFGEELAEDAFVLQLLTDHEQLARWPATWERLVGFASAQPLPAERESAPTEPREEAP